MLQTLPGLPPVLLDTARLGATLGTPSPGCCTLLRLCAAPRHVLPSALQRRAAQRTRKRVAAAAVERADDLEGDDGQHAQHEHLAKADAAACGHRGRAAVPVPAAIAIPVAPEGHHAPAEGRGAGAAQRRR
jgi:hypothetical protein